MNLLYKKPWGLSVLGLFCAFALGGCELIPAVPAARAVHKSEPIAIESDTVKSLQRQIKERDKRIEELTSLLEALKTIDQDVASRRKLTQPPVTSIPIE